MTVLLVSIQRFRAWSILYLDLWPWKKWQHFPSRSMPYSPARLPHRRPIFAFPWQFSWGQIRREIILKWLCNPSQNPNPPNRRLHTSAINDYPRINLFARKTRSESPRNRRKKYIRRDRNKESTYNPKNTQKIRQKKRIRSIRSLPWPIPQRSPATSFKVSERIGREGGRGCGDSDRVLN